MYVCVRERERERGCVCVCARAWFMHSSIESVDVYMFVYEGYEGHAHHATLLINMCSLFDMCLLI